MTKPNPSRPIGVFDSGLGGLSIVRQINTLLPAEDVIFLADQANLPFGEKSPAEISRLIMTAVPMLITEGAKVVVIACNSASVSTIEELRLQYPETPFVAVIPAIKPAAERTKTGTIAVFATRTTLNSLLYAELKETHADNVTVVDIPCPEWVGMVESGEFSARKVKKPIETALRGGADQLVLGCTHYPFLADMLAETVAGRAELLESGPSVARQVERIIAANESRATDRQGTNRFLTSQYSERSEQVAGTLLGQAVVFESVGR